MNIVLFSESELAQGLPVTDRRVCHVQDVLSVAQDDTFDAGVVNGMRGKARFSIVSKQQVAISFQATEESTPLYPIDVVIGMSRPQTCRFVLRSLTTLGVRSIEFVATEKGERSYGSSQLWSSGEHAEIVFNAVSQAFETRIPAVRFDRDLTESLNSLAFANQCDESRVCLDNYEASTTITDAVEDATDLLKMETPIRLLIGSERGWSDGERNVAREHGFKMASMGPRVMRVETACVAAVSAILAQRFWRHQVGTLSTRKP